MSATGLRAWGWWIILAAFVVALPAAARETVPSLTIGTTTFSNVTMTGKSATHISFTHSRGFATVKLRNLDSNVLHQLGFQLQSPHSHRTLALPKAIQFDPRWADARTQMTQQVVSQIKNADRYWLWIGLGVMVLLYFVFCYACLLICEKAGAKPDSLVWVPVVQLVPLLRAANMSPWNLLLFLVPVVSILIYLIWCIKICQASRKSPWLAFFLFFPFTSALAFLYLALGNGPDPERSLPKVQLVYQR